ncbi:hypothetical protein O3P69_001992 [Scylla paramamosain]|uniref:Uncharacterized protein n=1 Tax=Scylla paramamosain TaxID=85552 RepID=A0AAW0V6C3_SCYPA
MLVPAHQVLVRPPALTNSFNTLTPITAAPHVKPKVYISQRTYIVSKVMNYSGQNGMARPDSPLSLLPVLGFD